MAFWRKWPWQLPRRGDIAALALLAAFLAALIFHGASPVQPLSNWGFGKDWRCVFVGRGEPVCIKDTSQRPSDER
jgi:hypothetical protein